MPRRKGPKRSSRRPWGTPRPPSIPLAQLQELARELRGNATNTSGVPRTQLPGVIPAAAAVQLPAVIPAAVPGNSGYRPHRTPMSPQASVSAAHDVGDSGDNSGLEALHFNFSQDDGQTSHGSGGSESSSGEGSSGQSFEGMPSANPTSSEEGSSSENWYQRRYSSDDYAEESYASEGPPSPPPPMAHLHYKRTAEPVSAVQQVTRFLVKLKSTHKVSKVCMNTFIDFLQQNDAVITQAKQESGGKLPVFQTMLRREAKYRPRVFLDFKFTKLDDNTVYYETGVDCFPLKKYGDDRVYREDYSITYQNLQELIEFHNLRHVNEPATTIVMAIDDVPESKSTPKKETIVALNFPPCREVYGYKVLRPLNGESISVNNFLGPIVAELNQCDLEVSAIVMDKPMRAKMCKHVGHNGYFTCQVCLCRGQRIKDVKTGFLSSGDPIRTDADVRHIAENLDTIKGEDRQGLKGRSPLLDLKAYDAVETCSQDYMHSWILGVARRTFELTFESKRGKQLGRLRDNQQIVDAMEGMLRTFKTPSEFSRRTKVLHFKHLKASQWLHIVINLFPMLLQSLEAKRRIQDIWALLCFLIRAYLLHDDEFARVKAKYNLQRLHYQFQRLYQKAFGTWNCTYNVHVVQHGKFQRLIRAYYRTSAFKFEGSYGEIMKHAVPGTKSIGKQAMEGHMRRKVEGHSCKKSMKLSAEEKMSNNDTLIYTSDWKLYRIKDLQGHGRRSSVVAVELAKKPILHKLKTGKILDFADVGGFQMTGEEESGDYVRLGYNEIAGKGVQCEDNVSYVSQIMMAEFS